MTTTTTGETPAGTDHDQDWSSALDSVLDHVYDSLALTEDENSADTDEIAAAWLHQLDEILLLDESQYSYVHNMPIAEIIRPADITEMRSQALVLLAA